MLPLKDNVPTRTTPVVTIGLIVANFIVWFWELAGTPWQEDVVRDGFYPCSIPAHHCLVGLPHHLPWYEGAFTSMFLHAGWEHILGNMLFLWIFGNNVEDALGHVRFLFWYLAAGLAATATQTVVTLAAASQAGANVPNVGASGAIAGVLGAYFLLLPRAKVLTWVLFFLIEIPAFWFLGLWFLYQLVSTNYAFSQPESGGGVAFFAHIGGFVFGALTVRLVQTRPPLRPAY